MPTERVSQAPKLSESIWVFHGPPGIGKSTLASGFHIGDSTPYFLYTSSVKYIEAYKTAIPSWKKFVEIVKLLEAGRPKRYSFIIIDVIDILYLHCRKEVCEQLGIEHESDLPHGKGWDAVKKEFTRWIAKLCTIGYGVIFVTHSDWREVTERIAKYTRVVPTLQGAAWRVLYPLADFVGYCGFGTEEGVESGTRTVFFEPTEYIEAKDWTGKLPKAQKMFKDPTRTADVFKAALEGKSTATTSRRRRVVKRKA